MLCCEALVFVSCTACPLALVCETGPPHKGYASLCSYWERVEKVVMFRFYSPSRTARHEPEGATEVCHYALPCYTYPELAEGRLAVITNLAAIIANREVHAANRLVDGANRPVIHVCRLVTMSYRLVAISYRSVVISNYAVVNVYKLVVVEHALVIEHR